MLARRIAPVLAWLTGCDPPATTPTAAPEVELRPALPDASPAAPVPRASVSLPAAWRWLIAPPERPSLSQVVALSPGHALALGDGRLYILTGARWAAKSLAEGTPRALAEGAGALWVLAEGAGGQALLYRSGECCALELVHRLSLGPGHRPRALAVVGARDVYIAGVEPALVRVHEGRVAPIAVAAPVVALAPGAAIGASAVALHEPPGVTIVRGDTAEPAPPLEPDARVFVSRRWLFTAREGALRAWPGTTVRGPGSPLPRGPAAVLGLNEEDAPIALVAGGGALWDEQAQDLVHTSEPDGTRMYFHQTRPAWTPIRGPLPREPIAVLPTTPRLVAGREGELSVLDRRGAEARAIVAVPRPVVLALVAAADGALVLVGVERVTWKDASGTRHPRLGDAELQWLAQAARDRRAGRPALMAAAGAGGVLLASESSQQALRVDREGASLVALESWPGGLAAAGEGAWIVLLGHGRVVRVDAGGSRSLGELSAHASIGVSHTTGAFTGPDGRVRLVARHTPLVCAGPSGLQPCGPVPDADPAHLWPLRDGLVVMTQSIDTRIVDASGVREVDNLWTRGEVIACAGDAAAPVALVQPRGPGPPELLRLGAAGWAPIAAVPAACVPQAIASHADSLAVACEGEALLEL